MNHEGVVKYLQSILNPSLKGSVTLREFHQSRDTMGGYEMRISAHVGSHITPPFEITIKTNHYVSGPVATAVRAEEVVKKIQKKKAKREEVKDQENFLSDLKRIK